jgi:23S rRNA pseudouridine1911/1915/1917 synthase
MPLELIITVEPSQKAGLRLDRALADALKKNSPHVSRATLKDYFTRRQVRVSGRTASASHVLSPGVYKISISDWDESAHKTAPKAEPSKRGSFIPVLYEDASLLVLNKTSGVPSVPHSSQETETAVSSALAHAPFIQNVGYGGLEPGLLHRLDNGTSGILVFAKTDAEFHRLKKQWKTTSVKKTYRARLSLSGIGVPQKLKWLMAHDAKSDKRMLAFPDGIRANSYYRSTPLETITKLVKLHAPTDIEIEIETGVMHQIRCVVATLGYPILGDAIYGGEISTRLWLHAWKLELPMGDGTSLTLEAPLPMGWPEKAAITPTE